MKLIDKDALIAEIERRRESNAKEKFFGRLVEDNYFLSLIDTLEMKKIGIDLGDPKGDKGAKYILDTKILEVKEVGLEEDVDRILEEYDWSYDKIDFYNFAKHFFELGMQVSNKAQKENKL